MFGTFKTMINVGKNISNDYELPIQRSLDKNQNYELRLYETNKYAVIKHRQVDESSKSKKEKKDENDPIMKNVWKLMKYTQGENETKTNMKFLMPVFVQVETLNEGGEDEASNQEKMIEVKVIVSLPKEYQVDKSDPSKKPLEPPTPLDAEIQFEVIEQFKCFVRVFQGFANDEVYKNEKTKLEELLQASKENVQFEKNKIICISYDPPYKLFNRRNEIMLFAL